MIQVKKNVAHKTSKAAQPCVRHDIFLYLQALYSLILVHSWT